MIPQDLPVIAFKNKKLFNHWLRESYDTSEGIWLRIYKKDSEVETVTYQEALEEALCYGWIDGLKKTYDSKSWIQKFTPRRSKSIWSQRNTVIVQQLIDQKRMRAPGLKVIEAAKADGRWDNAYASQKNMEIPAQYLSQIKKNQKLHEAFKALKRSDLYSIAFRLHHAKKEETRERHWAAFIEKLKQR